MVQLSSWILLALWQSIRRIGEVDVSIGLQYPIVRAVEPLALVIVRKRSFAPVWCQHTHATVPVFAHHEIAIGVFEQPVGSRLKPIIGHPGVARRLHEQADSMELRPTENRIARNVGKEQVAIFVVTHPQRAFGPSEPVGQDLEFRVDRQKLVKLRFEALDGPKSPHGCLRRRSLSMERM